MVTKVFAPWVFEELKNYLKYVNFVTVSYSTPKHKHVKKFPILVCRFQEYDLEHPVNKKSLFLWKSQGKLHR
jgi:hypothetical protein